MLPRQRKGGDTLRRNSLVIYLVALLLVLATLTVPGVYALWTYFTAPSPTDADISNTISPFEYGLIYITQIKQLDSAGSSAMEKTAATDVHADINLGASGSSVSYQVTFYNSTDVTYYYNEAQTISANHKAIGYEVTGIAQKDAVPSKTYKTLTITFTKTGASATPLSADIHFSFVVDKDSIGIVVAQTAVDRFLDILNNKVAPDSYHTLESAMNANGGGWGADSRVTYIGNVSGSTSADTRVIESLFGEEFMSMDLDGNGTAEPITMMIKRENLDNNTATGADYTYSSWLSTSTVRGVEMTLYITAQNLDDVGRGDSVTVYAATFTLFDGESQWVELVPLTMGTASPNNYSSGALGSLNSFNTDTWKSTNGKTMSQLVREATQ